MDMMEMYMGLVDIVDMVDIDMVDIDMVDIYMVHVDMVDKGMVQCSESDISTVYLV